MTEIINPVESTNKSEKERLINNLKEELSDWQEVEDEFLKAGDMDTYHALIIYHKGLIKILEDEGVESYNKHKKYFKERLKSDHATLHMLEWAKKHDMTNTEYLRWHLHNMPKKGTTLD